MRSKLSLVETALDIASSKRRGFRDFVALVLKQNPARDRKFQINKKHDRLLINVENAQGEQTEFVLRVEGGFSGLGF